MYVIFNVNIRVICLKKNIVKYNRYGTIFVVNKTFVDNITVGIS